MINISTTGLKEISTLLIPKLNIYFSAWLNILLEATQ